MENNFKTILSYWAIKEKNQNNQKKANISNNNKNNNKNNNSENDDKNITNVNTTITNSSKNDDANSNSITTIISSSPLGYENIQSIEHQSQTNYKSITTSMESMLINGDINKDNLIINNNNNNNNNSSTYSVYSSDSKIKDGDNEKEEEEENSSENESIYSAYKASSSIFSYERPVGDSTSSLYGNNSSCGYGPKKGNGYDIDDSSSIYSSYGLSYGGSDNYSSSYGSNYGSNNDDECDDKKSNNDIYSYGGNDKNNNNSDDENELKIKQEKYLQETRNKKISNENKGRDWNQEFQSLLRLQPSLEKFQKLTFLAMDFVNFAENYGFIIIKEMFLPDHLKTIKPIDIGGIAGGQKFICQGILFKFAYDTKIGENGYLYGGKYPSETSASKAAGNELKSLSSFFQHVLDNEFADKVNVPLMCIIDYFGYRLIAMSVMEINKQTLTYGSSDGGITVHAEDLELNSIMETIGNSMNLRGHLTGINPKFMYGPGDLEVHKSKGQYYVVDFGRLLPPQSFYIDQPKGKSNSRDIFYKMIRPELLKQSVKPLSSDSYSGWGLSDPNHLEYNKDIDELTTRLYNEIIPNAAKEIQNEWERLSPLGNDYLDQLDISVEAHKYGINHRHLGRIRSLITNKSLRKSILNEMVARVFRNQIKEDQRIQLTGQSVSSEEKCVHIIVSFLNRIIGNDRFDTLKDFWTISIKTLILKKYSNGLSCLNGGLSDEELDTKFDLLDSIDLYQVLLKFQNKSGIKLSSRVKSILKKASTSTQKIRLPVLFYTDIKSIRPVVKHSNMIARSEGISLYMKAVELIYSNQVYYGRKVQQPDISRFNSDFSEEIGLLEACNQKLSIASRSSTTDSSLYHLLGLVDFELLKIKPNGATDVVLRKSAKDKLLASVRYNENPNNLTSLATILDVCGDFKQSEEIYNKLKQMDPLVVVPLLFESASLYSPYHTKITSEKLLAVSFHQFLNLIDILLSLPSDSLLVRQYLQDSYKILTILILRTASTPDFQIHTSVTKFVTMRKSIEFNHQDIIEQTREYIENAFKFNLNLIDDFILESSSQFPSRIPFTILLKYSIHCPSLRSRILSFIQDTKSFNKFNPEIVKHIFSNEDSLTTLTETLKIQLDYIILKRRYVSFGNQIQLQSLIFDSLYLNSDSFYQFINDLSNISNNLKYLKILGGRYNNSSSTDDQEQQQQQQQPIDYSKLNFNSLTHLDIEDNEFPNELLIAILKTSKNTLKDVRLHYYDMPIDCLELVGSLYSVEKILLRNMEPKVNVNHIPTSVKEIIIDSQMSTNQPLSELMKRCPNLVEFKLTTDEIIGSDLKSLKPYPIKSLDINSYSDYLKNNDMSNDIQNWSNSLTNLKLFSSRPFEDFSNFVSQLKSIKILDLRFNADDNQINNILLSLKNLENFKIESNKYQLLLTNQNNLEVKNESVKSFTISNSSTPSKNYSNIGLLFPNLDSLDLIYPKSMNDVSFRGMIENLHISSLSLSCCYDLTDNSMIALCNSPIASNLKTLSSRDFPISDGSIVKIIFSCPKLLRIHKSSSFKRPETLSFIRSSYPSLIIDF
ncbi:hypothetical protein ACTFIZ_003048 [Dictyostelium cf. discoideum]